MGNVTGVCFEDDENQEANSFGNNPPHSLRLLIWTAVTKLGSGEILYSPPPSSTEFH